MKVALTSDTHYGHSHNTHRIHEKFLRELKELYDDGYLKLLIHAGDWSSMRQDEFRRTLAMFRRMLGDMPILAVRGNHDFWDKKKSGRRMERRYMWFELMRMHAEWFKEYNIHHLENNPYIVDPNTIIVGYDGWYGNSNPPSNDEMWMRGDIEGCPVHSYLGRKAYKDLDNLLAMDLSQYRTKVLVTHHPPYVDEAKWEFMAANLRYLEPIVEKFDIFCTGHSHHYRDDMEGKCRIINCGSHYDSPQRVIFDI